MELLARVTRSRIALVVAPAGYGKSVAVAHYLARVGMASLWFVVRDEHTKLLGFAGGLADALVRDVPSLERGLLGAYQSSAGTDRPVALAVWFASQLDDGERTVVIDDVHLCLEEGGVRDFIVALVERAPPRVRFVLLGRNVLDLPLTAWLASRLADEVVVEDDLRIRPDEAAAIARANDVALDDARLEELLALTAGWPAAFTFALRAAAHGTDLGRIGIETRDNLYAYLADQAFGVLSPSEQRFLLGTALLPVIDLELLEAAGWEAPRATYARLRRHASFIVPKGPTTFAYHDLFRDFLQHRLRLKGSDTYRSTQLASAALCEAAGRADAAMHLRVEAGDVAGLVRMLRVEASRLTLGGMVDPIEEAMLVLPQPVLRRDADLLGLLARTRALRNTWHEADTLYEAAIACAQTADQRAMLCLSHAASLHNRGSYDAAFAVLAALDPAEIGDLATHTRLLAHLAVLQAMRRDFDEAARLEGQILRTVLIDPELRARVFYSACLVSHYSNRLRDARRHGAEALKAAEQCDNSYFIARCCHFASVAATNDGDWEGASRLLARVRLHAEREGDLGTVNHALQMTLALAPMRGDGAAIAEADAALGRGFEVYPDSDNSRSFARAMRHAWSGDFQAARREAELGLQTPAGEEQREPIVSLAHAALYHAAAGDRRAASAAIDRATTHLAEFAASGALQTNATIVQIGRVVLALAHALLLRPRVASGILSQLERGDPKPIPALGCLLRAARTFNRVAQGVAARETLNRDVANVQELGLGGYADLLAALPVGIARSASAFATLTKAELRMLRLIARGGTLKEIASEIGRSPDTVETHVRAILRKLGCSRRSEAIALAHEHGII
jgi:DNA-binding CsgD family transcriptional regulator